MTDILRHSAFSLENLVELKASFNRFRYGRAFFRFLLQLDFSEIKLKCMSMKGCLEEQSRNT